MRLISGCVSIIASLLHFTQGNCSSGRASFLPNSERAFRSTSQKRHLILRSGGEFNREVDDIAGGRF